MSEYYEIDKSRLEVGSHVRFDLTVFVGGRGVAEGGAIRIEFPWGCWTPPVMAEIKVHAYLQHVNAEAIVESRHADIEVVPRVWYRGVLNPFVTLTVVGGELVEGDSVVFRYGLPSKFLPPARCQTYPSESASFRVRIRGEAAESAQWREVKQRGNLSVVAGPAARLELVLPSIAVAGTTVSMRHVFTDRMRNESEGSFEGPLAYEVTHGKAGILGHERDSGPATDISVTPQRPPILRVGARGERLIDAVESIVPMTIDSNLDYLPLPRAENRELAAPIASVPARWAESARNHSSLSNPCRVFERDPGYSVFWGDLHIHTDFSDGRLPIDEAYRYARDVAKLDIAAATDHECGIEIVTKGGATRGRREWEATQKAATEWNEAGRFVTLRGFEWTSNRYGHRNVYLPDAGVDEVFGTLDSDYVHYRMEPTHLYETLGESNLLIIPHHTLVSTDWSYYDPRERLVEVYSTWGRTEYPGNEGWDKPVLAGGGALEGLRRGYRFGLIGGSDAHDSRGGRCYPSPPARNLNYRSGLMAVLAKDLTRGSVYEALWNRHVYATTGERIYLSFTIGGHLMGSSVDMPADTEAELHCEVGGTRPLKKLEIIDNGEVREAPIRDSEFAEYGGAIQIPDAGQTRFIYIRAQQCDGNMAWSSPIWVTGV